MASPNNKVMIIELCRRRQLIANVSAYWVELQLGDVLTNIGPMVESIRVYGYGEDFGAGFSYRVNGQFSNNGTDWSDFATSIHTETGTGNKIGSPYTTTGDFGLNLRFKLGSQATTAGTGGTVTVFVAITFKS